MILASIRFNYWKLMSKKAKEKINCTKNSKHKATPPKSNRTLLPTSLSGPYNRLPTSAFPLNCFLSVIKYCKMAVGKNKGLSKGGKKGVKKKM